MRRIRSHARAHANSAARCPTEHRPWGNPTNWSRTDPTWGRGTSRSTTDTAGNYLCRLLNGAEYSNRKRQDYGGFQVELRRISNGRAQRRNRNCYPADRAHRTFRNAQRRPIRYRQRPLYDDWRPVGQPRALRLRFSSSTSLLRTAAKLVRRYAMSHDHWYFVFMFGLVRDELR